MSACKEMLLMVLKDIDKYSCKQEIFKERVEQIKLNFIKLKKFNKEESIDLDLLLFALGISEYKDYRKLNITQDEAIYDIIETYELPLRLIRCNGDWTAIWTSIEWELTSESVFGSTPNSIVEKLYKAFMEIKEVLTVQNVVDWKEIRFNSFARNCAGDLIYIKFD